MLCCPLCFGDSWIEWKLRTEQNSIGFCNFCGAENQPLVEPSTLTAYFQILVDCFEESRLGMSLGHLLRADWGLFSRLSSTQRDGLLDSILGHDFHLRLFLPPDQDSAERVQQWDFFREELKHNNRFFPKNIPNQEDLQFSLFSLRIELLAGTF